MPAALIPGELAGTVAEPGARRPVRRPSPAPKLPAFPAILFTDDAPPRGIPEVEGALLPEVSPRSVWPSKPAVRAATSRPPVTREGSTPATGDRPAGTSTPSAPSAPSATGPALQVQSRPPAPAVPMPSGSIWVVVRDPWTLVAHWSFRTQELVAWAAQQGPGEWRIRVHEGTVAGWIRGERPADLSQSFSFLPLANPGGTFVVELGWATNRGEWRGLALTLPVTTEGEMIHFPRSMPWVKAAVVGQETSASSQEEVASAREDSWPEPVALSAPGPAPVVPGAALAPRVSGPSIRTRELARLVTEPDGHFSGEASSAALAERTRLVVSRVEEAEKLAGEAGPDAVGQPEAGQLPSSPAELPPAPPGFWFEVNAEVILYGRTARDARVTIGDRPVRLREDGSFSFRFALPDGDFSLPVVAVNAAGTDRRAAAVRFTRATVLTGEVGVHPQDPALRPPRPEFAE